MHTIILIFKHESLEVNRCNQPASLQMHIPQKVARREDDTHDMRSTHAHIIVNMEATERRLEIVGNAPRNRIRE